MVLELYGSVGVTRIDDLFICDAGAQPESDSVAITNLWLFAEGACMEADNFIGMESFDQVYLSSGITRWQLTRANYRPGNARPESRLHIQFAVDISTGGMLDATGGNCEHLWRIFKEQLLPHVKRS